MLPGTCALLAIGASREELAVAAASRDLGQPVKWVEARGENLTASGQAREESFDVRAAVSNDGDLLGLDVKMVIDTGSYPGMGGLVPGITEAMLPGPYKMAAMASSQQRSRRTSRRMSPTAARGRPRHSCGDAPSTSSRKSSASSRWRSGCVTSLRGPIRRPSC
jgi:CO/xanthine dehydrogenase Mo-binding subunit